METSPFEFLWNTAVCRLELLSGDRLGNRAKARYESGQLESKDSSASVLRTESSLAL